MNCTRCQGTGFLNLQQIPDRDMALLGAAEHWELAVLSWIASEKDHDVQVCDCCGDGDDWYGEPGEHTNFSGEYPNEPFPGCY
jgi:hypothetical protein